jgi:hypothetical protein
MDILILKIVVVYDWEIFTILAKIVTFFYYTTFNPACKL